MFDSKTAKTESKEQLFKFEVSKCLVDLATERTNFTLGVTKTKKSKSKGKKKKTGADKQEDEVV